MKPVGRSLEIAAIGLGQAGGNIAAEFQRRGYRALAFNTAQTDLTSLGMGRLALPVSQHIYIGLEGLDGAGSDVEYGRECIAAHADQIREAVAKHTAGADVVILAAGLGGGTGSCAAEFTAVLEDLSLPIVILTTLPHSYESGIAKVNALCGVRNLARTPAFGWVMIDNARLARLHHDVPIDTYFEMINRDIVEPLDVLNRLNDRDSTRAIRTLDGEDFRTLLLSGGVLNYSTRVLPKLNANQVLESVRAALADNPIMPSGSELRNVAYLGLVIEASERALAESPFSLFEEIAQAVKSETGGAAVYVGLYRQLSSDDTSTTVRVLSSSHALPASIGEMLAEAEREAGTIQHKVQQNVEILDLGGLERLRLARRPIPRSGRAGRPASTAIATPPSGADESKPTAAKPASVPVATAPVAVQPPAAKPVSKPVVAAPAPKLEAVEPRPVRASAPVAPVAPHPPAMKTTKVDELRRMVVNGPASEPIETSASVDPSRGRYERLANAFRDAVGDDKRVYIARELIAAQRSGEALERFYAVNAMARVDASYFREALSNATRDADPHVADLARRALAKLANAS